jgi:hypothetical protein
MVVSIKGFCFGLPGSLYIRPPDWSIRRTGFDPDQTARRFSSARSLYAPENYYRRVPAFLRSL